MNLDSIKSTLNSEVGRSLKEYLQERLEELKDIDNIKDIETPTNQAVEIKAQKKAYNKLKAILAELMTFSEKPKVKDKRDSYDII